MPRWDGSSDPPPNERRVDGGRITGKLQSDIWLNDPNKNSLTRISPEADILPNQLKLEYTKERDHLHDNQRANNTVDPAQPGHTQYIYVTRRIDNQDPANERRLMEERRRQQQVELEREAEKAREMNEILELKSLGIRTAMAAFKELQDAHRDGGRAHTYSGKLSKAAASSAFFM